MRSELHLDEVTIQHKKIEKKRILTLVFFIMLLDVIGLSILVPITPFLVKHYSANALNITLLSAIYAAAQFFSAPFLGKLSDRVGRKVVLFTSILGSVIGYLLFGIGGALWVLFFSRLIDGITAGNMSTAIACITDVSPAKERTQNFAIIGMAFGLGFILGPALGGFFSRISLVAPAFAAAGLSLVSLLLIAAFSPETLPHTVREKRPLRISDLNPFASIAEVIRKPGLTRLLIANGLFELVFSGVNAITGLYVIQKFNAEAWQIGLLFVTGGLALAVVQAGLIGPISKRLGDKTVSIATLFGQVIMLLVFLITPSLLLLYPVFLILNAITGFLFSSLGSLISRSVSDHEQGVLQGASAALNSVTVVLGAVWAGLLYDHIDKSAPLWIGACLLALTGVIMLKASTGLSNEEIA